MPIAKRETEPLLPNAADIDVIGPFAEKLFDLDHIYNRNEYPTVHARADEWLTVNESEATPYLPDPNTRKVTIGIKELETVDLPVGAVLNLNNHISTKYAFILNLGFSVFALEFAPKRPEIDSARHTQYLAIAGFRGAENEHHYYTDSYTHGEYKNSIMLWRCELVNTEQAQQQQQQQQPVLDLCLLHDFGPIKEIKWCPYGAYEEVS
ncbi:hypothetical protein BDB00DRAFT_772514 [Zychaea mexicana]|uniref:uncharacterized protein n=1 Tax=Zychaea mexicana TaxID=64656 RepID=UPI0022FEF842|nr:uncharacterized protein BDB00DRAFT_772514 [Zychaea mexicana]KAI9488444.1 hypothetical protein BDB00DRAFT_772514 [Zychaea mexicana]